MRAQRINKADNIQTYLNKLKGIIKTRKKNKRKL